MITEELWSRFEVVLQKHMPIDYAALMPPASDAQIQAAEKAMGKCLPDEIKFIYRQHNGMNSGADSAGNYAGNFLFNRLRWCSLDEMVDHGKMMSSLCDQWRIDYPEKFPQENGHWRSLMVQPVSHNKDWISIGLSGSMPTLYIDTAPAPGGSFAQLIHNSSDGAPIAMAPSMHSWIKFICDAFETGQLALNSDKQWMDMRSGNPKHVGLGLYWAFNPDQLKPGLKITLE